MKLFFLIGTVSDFKRKFENPILQSRDADATDQQQKKGEEKLAEVEIYFYNNVLCSLPYGPCKMMLNPFKSNKNTWNNLKWLH